MTGGLKGTIHFAEMFGKSITLYADNFLLFSNLSVAATLSLIFKMLLGGAQNSGLPFSDIILLPVFFCGYSFFAMALVYAVGSRAQGHALTLIGSIVHVSQRFWRVIGGSVLFGALITGGVLLLVLPGIYCATVFYFFSYAMLFEDKHVWDSFKRSDELVKGRFLQVFCANLLVIISAFAFQLPLFMGMKMIGVGSELFAAVSGMAGAIIMPVFIGFYYFIYVALKEEKDGVLSISVHT